MHACPGLRHMGCMHAQPYVNSLISHALALRWVQDCSFMSCVKCMLSTACPGSCHQVQQRGSSHAVGLGEIARLCKWLLPSLPLFQPFGSPLLSEQMFVHCHTLTKVRKLAAVCLWCGRLLVCISWRLLCCLCCTVLHQLRVLQLGDKEPACLA